MNNVFCPAVPHSSCWTHLSALEQWLSVFLELPLTYTVGQECTLPGCFTSIWYSPELFIKIFFYNPVEIDSWYLVSDWGVYSVTVHINNRCVEMCSDKSTGCGLASRCRQQLRAETSSTVGRPGRQSRTECSWQCWAQLVVQCQPDELQWKCQSNQLRDRRRLRRSSCNAALARPTSYTQWYSTAAATVHRFTNSAVWISVHLHLRNSLTYLLTYLLHHFDHTGLIGVNFFVFLFYAVSGKKYPPK